MKTYIQQSQSKKLRNKNQKQKPISVLPYENTYGQFYEPNQFIPVEQAMLDKIVNGVRAMAVTLTNKVNKSQMILMFIFEEII